MDKIDARIVELLQLDGRITISELSKHLSLSRPSVAERVKRLQDSGIIEGYSARVSAKAIGREMLVFIQLSDVRVHALSDLEHCIVEDPDIIECHRLTGSVSYLLKAAVGRIDQLGELINRLLAFGSVNTSIVLSSPVPYRHLKAKVKENTDE